MKKLISILATVVTLLFFVIIFQYFNLLPYFQSLVNNITTSLASEDSQITETLKTTSTKTPSETAKTPEDPIKIKRHRTYNELLHKGNTLLENGYPNLAIHEYTQAAQENPEASEPYQKIGLIHFQHQDFEKALINFNTAQKLTPNNLEINLYIARTYLGLTEYNQAKNLLDTLTEENQLLKLYQGLLAAFYNETDRAKELFTQTIEISTTEETNQKAQTFLNAYQEYENTQGTQAVYLKILLGNAYVQSGEYNLAKEILFEVIKEKNDYRDAWILLGYTYLEEQAYNDALKALETALEMNPIKAETLFFLGLTHFGLDNYEQAIHHLELAKDNGFEPLIQVQQKLAELYVLTENYEKAIENYEAVINQNSSDLEYFIRPIWIYIDKLKQAEKALTLAQKAFNIHPKNALSYNFLGWAYLALNDHPKATENLNQAININPNLGAAYLNFGQLYETQGLPEKAKENYQKAYQLSTNTSVGNLAAEKYNRLVSNDQ